MAASKARKEEEEKKRMIDEEKLDKLRADQNKGLSDDFESEYKQMINVPFIFSLRLSVIFFKESIDESKKSIANPIKINLASILKKKTKLQEKPEEEKVQEKSHLIFIEFANLLQ